MPAVRLNNIVKKILKDPNSGSARVYYFGTIPSNQVKSLTFVPVDEETPIDTPLNEAPSGYQRFGNTTRMRNFKKYLSDNPLAIVPPVVLSSRNKWKFIPSDQNENFGELEANEPAAIIDGQHRIGGYVYYDDDESREDIKDISFILIPDVETDQEVKEFIDINQKQQKVTLSHVVYLSAEYLDDEDSTVALQLGQRSDSLLYKKIFKQKALDGELYNLAAIKSCVELSFKRGGLKELPIDTKISTLIQYWQIIGENHSHMLPDLEEKSVKNMKYKLFELTGIYAYSMVAPEILGGSYSAQSQTFNWDEINQKIKRASTIDWRKDGEYQDRAGKVAAAQYLKPEIESLIGGLTQEDENEGS